MPATEEFQRTVLPPMQSQVTLFGATGQVGRMAAAYIGSAGVKMIVPYRDHGMSVREIKMAGDVGQVAPKQFSFTDKESVKATMVNSNLVINCIGSYTPTMHYNEHDANVKTAYRIAETAKEMGVDRFIHVSAAGASEKASSKFLQAKWESEEVVKQFFPNASIIRPCFIFNPDDEYLHSLASAAATAKSHIVPFADTRIQPTYARDVGAAVAQIALNPEIDGQVWTLGGTKTYTRGELYDTFRKMINRQIMEVNPTTSLGAVGSLVQFLKDEAFYLHKSHRLTPIHSTDYFKSNVTLDTVPLTKGFKELGIEPTDTELAFIRVCRPYMSITQSPALQPSLFHRKIM